MRQMSEQKTKGITNERKQWWEQNPLPKFIKDTYGDIYEHVYGDIYRTRLGRISTISYLKDFMSPITVLGDEPPEGWYREPKTALKRAVWTN